LGVANATDGRNFMQPCSVVKQKFRIFEHFFFGELDSPFWPEKQAFLAPSAF
jgi:hypothetical protein